jgi:glutamyl-tRNA reductase
VSVLVVGLSHKSAPVATLERAAVSGDTLAKLLVDLAHEEPVAETFVISTCNRVEVYADRFHAGVATACRDGAGSLVVANRTRRRAERLAARSGADMAPAVRRVVDKLLHAPTVRVRELAGSPGGEECAAKLRVSLRSRSTRGRGGNRRRPGAG